MFKCVRVLHHGVVWSDPVDSWLNPNNLFVQSVHTLQIPKCILNMIYRVTKTFTGATSKICLQEKFRGYFFHFVFLRYDQWNTLMVALKSFCPIYQGSVKA